MNDDIDDGRSYLEIEIEGESSETEIWLGDDAGSLVQKEVGVLRSSLGGQFACEFLQAYGVESVDAAKLSYYQLVDEFF
ncbi:MAG: hypothetical protein ABR517_01915 [Thermoanaerobaculia bacterium]